MNGPGPLLIFPIFLSALSLFRLTGEIALDEDLLAAIADLKDMLAAEDIPLAILQDEEKGFDQIILGTYPPNEELQKYVDGFGIDFGNSQITATPAPTSETGAESIEPTVNIPAPIGRIFIVPGFGEIPQNGFGYLLLQENSVRTSLIILADSQKNAINLLKLLSAGSIDGCLANDFIAVCQQDAILSPDNLQEIPVGATEELPSEILLTATELAPLPPTATPSTPAETPVPTPVP